MLIEFEAHIANRVINDTFLWPSDVRSTVEMKIFGVNLLSDYFGRSFGALDSREIECK